MKSLSLIKKLQKIIVILHKRRVFNFEKAHFYQNDVLFDSSIKMSRLGVLWGTTPIISSSES
jgi:hypothetical protein